jgi:hypothetical protein
MQMGTEMKNRSLDWRHDDQGPGYAAEIITGDAGLKAYQPTAPILTPRRRRRR